MVKIFEIKGVKEGEEIRRSFNRGVGGGKFLRREENLVEVSGKKDWGVNIRR